MAINFSGAYGKVWGAHGVPTPTQVALGAAGWTQMFLDWANNVSGSNWTDWIKPQVDAAYDAGCNTFALFGCIDGVNAATISQATVNSRWAQLADYLDGLGMALYPKLCGFNQLVGCTNAEIAAYCLSIMDEITPRVEVIGVDVISEANAWDDGGGIGIQAVADRVLAIYDLIKPDTDLPLTFSNTHEWNGTDARDWMAKIVDGACDYLDFHPYSMNGWATPIAIADADYWISNYPSRDFIFGEGGSNQSSTELAQSAFCDGMASFMNSGNSLFRGWIQWAATDQGTGDSDKWGLYTGSFVARAHLVRTMKKYSQAHIGARGISTGGNPVFAG